MSAAAASSGGAGNGETPAPEGTGTLRVNVASIVFDRADGQPEDDVKTWIHCVVLTGGKPNGRFWYSNEAEVNFGKTAVRPARFLNEDEVAAISRDICTWPVYFAGGQRQ